jgi:hypothetical protein
MSTRSLIAIESNNETKSVYAHWDGYLENNGVILQENYTTQTEVEALIELGDISSLQETVGTKHPFSLFDHIKDAPTLEKKQAMEDDFNNQYANMTTYYSRDRDEKGVEPQTFATPTEAVNANLTANIEFAYLFSDNEWHVATPDSDWDFSPLSTALLSNNIPFSLPQEKSYTVWADGAEVNDYLLTLDSARSLASQFTEDGYDNIVVDKYTDEHIKKNTPSI